MSSCGPLTSAGLQRRSGSLIRTPFSYGRKGPMKFKGLLVVACAAGLMVGCNNRTSNTTTTGTTGNEVGTTGTAGAGVSTSDKNFVNDIMSDGMAEVELSRLGKDRAASPEVKQFAQMMIDDHT